LKSLPGVYLNRLKISETTISIAIWGFKVSGNNLIMWNGMQLNAYNKGQSISISLVKTSGYEILDNAAIETISNSSPFPPFGNYIKQPVLKMNVVLVYEL
jgi:hypothetical protein